MSYGIRYRSLEERILANSYLEVETECWVWMGKTDQGGYGLLTMRISGRRSPVNRRPHRLMYEILIGPIPEGLELDHICTNRRCCNPGHTVPETKLENVKEMWSRKRAK